MKYTTTPTRSVGVPIAILALIATLLAAQSAAVKAEIYRYEDEAGRVVYTNVPPRIKNKRMRVVTQEISVIPGNPVNTGIILPAPSGIRSGSGSSVHHNKSSHSSSDSDETSFAGVPAQIDSTTQQGRDNTRHGILLDELNSEIKALNEAKKMAEQTSANPALKGSGADNLQQAIQSHERNINALQKELKIK
ncbi:MAG: DUF4124 domain-containing protein [Pseudomonadota bacterium]